MKIKTVYISKRPKFAILQDCYQWILCRKQNNRGEWIDKTYHPVLCDLFDELAETTFRRNTKRLNELKELEASIQKTYDLIFRVCTRLEKRF